GGPGSRTGSELRGGNEIGWRRPDVGLGRGGSHRAADVTDLAADRHRAAAALADSHTAISRSGERTSVTDWKQKTRRRRPAGPSLAVSAPGFEPAPVDRSSPRVRRSDPG